MVVIIEMDIVIMMGEEMVAVMVGVIEMVGILDSRSLVVVQERDNTLKK